MAADTPAAPALAIDPAVDRVSASEALELLVDAQGLALAGDPWAATARWGPFTAPLRAAAPSAGGDQTYWVRWAVRVAPGPAFERTVLVDSRNMQSLSLFWVAEGGAAERIAEAGLQPVAAGRTPPEPSPTLAWPIAAGGVQGHLYLRVQTRVSQRPVVEIWSPLAYAREDADRRFTLGLHLGALMGLLLIHAMLWRVLRDRSLSYYLGLGLALAVTLFQLATSGLGHTLLWSGAAGANPLIIAASACAMAALGLLFAVELLDLAKDAPRLTGTMWALALLWCLVPLLLYNAASMRWYDRLGPLLLLASIVCWVAAAVLGLRWRRVGARYFVYGWTLIGTAMLMRVAVRLQWLPREDWIYYSFNWATVLQMALLTMAMAAKVREEHRAHRELLLQHERDQAQRAAAERALTDKTRFLASVAHDIQQPLFAVGLAAEVMARQPLPVASRVPLEQIRSAVTAADEILAALALVVRLDADTLKPELRDIGLQDMLERVDNLFAPLASQKGLQWRVTPSLARVRSDPSLLERMLCNLVANAMRYTDRGGVLLACRPRGNGLLIQVWDTGRGIAASEHERIFLEHVRGPDAREGDRGLGLGLAIVRRCARLLQIDLSLRSVPGRGSCFSLLVPAAGPGE